MKKFKNRTHQSKETRNITFSEHREIPQQSFLIYIIYIFSHVLCQSTELRRLYCVHGRFIASVGGSRAFETVKDPPRKIEISENYPRENRYLTSGTVKNPS